MTFCEAREGNSSTRPCRMQGPRTFCFTHSLLPVLMGSGFGSKNIEVGRSSQTGLLNSESQKYSVFPWVCQLLSSVHCWLLRIQFDRSPHLTNVPWVWSSTSQSSRPSSKPVNSILKQHLQFYCNHKQATTIS